MKRTWENPIIRFDLEPIDDDEITGGGSGQGPVPVQSTYEEWLKTFACDLDGDGDTDEEDYRAWCTKYGFTPEGDD